MILYDFKYVYLNNFDLGLWATKYFFLGLIAVFAP